MWLHTSGFSSHRTSQTQSIAAQPGDEKGKENNDRLLASFLVMSMYICVYIYNIFYIYIYYNIYIYIIFEYILYEFIFMPIIYDSPCTFSASRMLSVPTHWPR